MCKEMVDAISVSILEAVEPQVTNGGASSSSITGTETQPKRQHHIYRVTEEAIRCSLGDSLHRCFGEALGLEQERTHESEKLVELFGFEVMKKVNRKLALMEAPTSSQQTKTSEASAASHTEDMARLVADILRKCKKHQAWLDSDESGGCCPDEVTPVEELRAEGAEPTQSSDQAGCLRQDCSTSSTEEVLPNETFLATFLWRLLDHIATETRTPIPVDFYGMLVRLIESTEEELTSALPQTPSNLHVCIYKKLCQEFGSAEELLSAVASNPVAFEEAAARTLKAKLAKSKKNVSFVKKVSRFFHKKTSKVTQGCEKNTSDVRKQESGPQEKKSFRILLKTI
ncbi:uncharacterized protein LOC111566534 [Amphiprion ocellaris]|uniref:uncharacterized protein LOC111566534 n=1 Tax=Amphiprion ocellaris TaxID=80972 RepID=UPI0024115EB5|nr:uncharacterized protein LOC111566534 [Amphiprion ocellaris]